MELTNQGASPFHLYTRHWYDSWRIRDDVDHCFTDRWIGGNRWKSKKWKHTRSSADWIVCFVFFDMKVYDPSETRILVTHASPGREGLLAQLSLYLKVRLKTRGSVSVCFTDGHPFFPVGWLYHFCWSPFQIRYCLQRIRMSVTSRSLQRTSDPISTKLFTTLGCYQEPSDKLCRVSALFLPIHETPQVLTDFCFSSDHQAALLTNTLNVVNRLPPSLSDVDDDSAEPSREEIAFKNLWNFNLPDAVLGWIVLDVNNGHVGAEMKSQGFNFAYRRTMSANPSNTSSHTHSPYAGSSPALSNATFPPRPYASSDKYKSPDPQHPGPADLSRNNSINGGGNDSSSDFNEGSVSKDNHRQSRRQSSMVIQARVDVWYVSHSCPLFFFFLEHISKEAPMPSLSGDSTMVKWRRMIFETFLILNR